LHAIVIGVDGVTLDLDGFTISGPVTCSGAPPQKVCTPVGSNADGVSGMGRSQTVVRNGQVRGFARGGVMLGARSRVESLHLSHNGTYGMYVESDSLIAGNTSWNNGWSGISARGSLVRDNTVSGNGSTGIWTAWGSVVTDNRITGNGGFGVQHAAGTTTGYGRNVFVGNAGIVVGATVKIADNLCDGAIC
jgi:hypothetical protein